MAKEKKGVRLEHISKIYQDPKTGKDFYAVKDTSLEITPGSFVTLLGPSGCGKTTTLRMIAGFESPDEGEIYLGGEPINALTPNKRDTAMVFQCYALLPHYNIFDNVAYGLKLRKLDKATIQEKVTRILKLVGLEGMEARMTNQLSGGQQQRVAIARALVNNPDAIIADEPTGNLDPARSLELMMLLEKINSMGTTVVVVTHAREIVDQFAKRVVAIDGGMVVSDQMGGYYQRPDLTKLTEEAVQQAASSARRRKVIAQQLGVAVEPAAEQEPEEEPVQEPVPQPVVQQQSKAAPRHLEDFSIDDLLHFGETSDEEVQA